MGTESQSILGVNRDYFSNFFLNFQAVNKFVTVSVRLILPKIGVDRFTGSQREIDIRYEFNFELL